MSIFRKNNKQKRITSIPTTAYSTNFRSQLEARWATFFNALGIKWMYEPDWFSLDNRVFYKPDFYLPDYNLWIEIKPPRRLSDKEREKAAFFVQYAKTGKDTGIKVYNPKILILACNVASTLPKIPQAWLLQKKNNGKISLEKEKLGFIDGRLVLVSVPNKLTKGEVLALTANNKILAAYRSAQIKEFR